ncbi:MAG: cytochrome c biogenesis protein CcdA, partial [Thermoplasmata archaeon]
SPCSIVLLLSMLSYTMSAGDDGKGEIGKRDGKRIKEGGRSRRDIGKSGWLTGLGVGLAFGAGMASVFFILGLFVAWFGLFVIGYLEYFMIIAGILMILMGVNNFKPLGNILDRLKNRIRMERCEDSKTDDSESFLIKGKKLIGSISRKSVYIGAFALGILFSLGWAPCAFSMILPAIILILTSSIGIWAGGILLGVFGLGHALPVIPLCIVSSETRNRLGTKYAKAGKWMISVFSLIIIFIGILMILRPFGYRFW